MACEIDGCDRPVNRDGVCLTHKLKTISFTGVHAMRKQREAGVTATQLQQEVIEEARKDGRDIRQKGVTSPSSGPLIS